MSCRAVKIDPPELMSTPGGLNLGSAIFIRGRMRRDLEGFSINLQNDDCEGCDIGLNFRPRTNGWVEITAREDGRWQELEKVKSPFMPGYRFKLIIVVTWGGYVIVVNNRILTEFKHRLSYQDVRFLGLNVGAHYYTARVYNKCRVPFIDQFHVPLKPSNCVSISGYVEQEASSFEVNLMADRCGKKIGLKFLVRFDQEDMILSSNCGPEGSHKVISKFPKLENLFQLHFVLYTDKFHIYLDSHFCADFPYYIKPADLKLINIRGDVALMDVEYEAPLSPGFLKPIGSEVEDGDMILVKGYCYKDAKSFFVGLLNSKSDYDEYALHINTNIAEDCVVLNSKCKGNWKKEEKHSLPDIFKQPVPFDLEILFNGGEYIILFNGIKLACFKARGKLEDIQAVRFGGDCFIYDIDLVEKEKNPCVERVPTPILINSWVSVTGVPTNDSKGFHINLQYDDSPNSDVALHIKEVASSGNLILNSKVKGKWRQEVVICRCACTERLDRDEKFEIVILVKPKFFSIFVNGEHVADYRHRCDPRLVNYIVLDGECNFFEPACY